MPNKDLKILLPGGAGLVGQNLVVHLKRRGYTNLVVLDKHPTNLQVMARLHPDVVAVQADLAEPGEWEHHFQDAGVVVMLQAQIGGLEPEPFVRNNVWSTQRILEASRRHGLAYLVHVSSSVVNSVADDHYTRTKRQQEELVLTAAIPSVVLRPTLMFGWFDRKHLGWLSRFMRRTPVFPIPGNGRYMRQPLYAADFCRIIVSCIEERRFTDQAFNITGLERVDYIDVIRQIRTATGARTPIVKIPYSLFHALLTIWAWFDRDPPFTVDQLKALVAHDEFEVIDWPGIFGVEATPFAKALDETFNDPAYGRVVLEF
jgi:nucleoside-diphosphate-sugar epimerase